MTPKAEIAALVERLESHMGMQDVGILLADSREAAATIRALSAANPVPVDAGGGLRVQEAWRQVMLNFGRAFGDLDNGYDPAVKEMIAAVKSLQPAPTTEGEDSNWIRIPKPMLEDLAEIGEVAESAMMSEKGWAEIGHAVWDVITREAEVTDWSSAIRGKFYNPGEADHARNEQMGEG